MSAKSSQAAISDLAKASREWRLWTRLGWHDIIARYRRSWAGPIWIVLSMATFIGAIGLIYGTLFKVPLTTYLPHVAVGLILWTFMASTISDSIATFIESEGYIRQVRRSLFVYVFRVITRNFIILAHQLLVAVAVVALFASPSLANVALALLGLTLLVMQAFWVATVLSILGARFRDLQPIAAIVLQLVFLITPILWPAHLLGDRAWIAEFNPAYHVIELVRAPLLGVTPSPISYFVAVALLVAGTAMAFALYGRFRHRIVYWL